MSFQAKPPTIPGDLSLTNLTIGTVKSGNLLNKNTIYNTYNTGVNPSGMAMTNKYLYIANNNNYTIPDQDSVTVVNLQTGLVETTITDASFNGPYTITINDGIAYVTNSNTPVGIGSGIITLIDTETNTVTGTLEGFDGPSGLVIKGTTGYTNNYGALGGAGSGNGTTITVFNINTNIVTTTITTDLAPAALAITPNKRYIYVANYVDGNVGTGTVQVIDTNTNLIIKTITGFSGPFSISVKPDSSKVYVTNFSSNNFSPFGTTVSIIDTVTNTLTKTITIGIQPSGLAFTPSGDFAYVSNYNTLYAGPAFTLLTPGRGTINIIDTETETLLPQTILVDQSPNAIVISPEGDFLYVSNYISNTVNCVYIG